MNAAPVEAARLDQLLAAMAAGDQEAFAQLYTAARAAVFGFALAILRSRQDAEDVTQETFVRAFLGADGYRSSGKPMAWLLTIAKHLSYEKHRGAGRIVALPDTAWLEAAAGELSPEERVVVRAAMECLSDEERQIVTLHAVSGLKHREIGDLLGLPLPTVLSKYHRALKKLRSELKEDDGHDRG